MGFMKTEQEQIKAIKQIIDELIKEVQNAEDKG